MPELVNSTAAALNITTGNEPLTVSETLDILIENSPEDNPIGGMLSDMNDFFGAIGLGGLTWGL